MPSPVAKIYLQAKFDVLAASGDGRVPRMRMVAYTGGKLVLPNYKLPVILDVSGIVPADTIKANLDHDRTMRLGHIDEFDNSDGRNVILAGPLSGNPEHVSEVVSTTLGRGEQDRYPWEASIEARPVLAEMKAYGQGQKFTVNGQQFEGPALVAYRSLLYGVALVTRGASEGTRLEIAASAAQCTGVNAMDFETWCKESCGVDPGTLGETQRATLEAAFKAMNVTAAEPPGGTKTNDGGAVTATQTSWDSSVILAAFTDGETELQATLSERGAAVRDQAKLDAISNDARQGMGKLKADALRGKWAPDVCASRISAFNSSLALKLVQAATPNAPAIQVIDRSINSDVIEAAFCLSRGFSNLDKMFKGDERAKSLEKAEKYMRGFGLQQAVIMAAASNGMRVGVGDRIRASNVRQFLKAAFRDNGDIHAASPPSTISLPGILSNIANKDILQGYQEQGVEWREIALKKTANDYKPHISYRLTDNFEYEELPKGGKMAHGDVGEESYTRQVKTYAKLFRLSHEDIVNDDLSAFDSLRERIGRGSARKQTRLAWATFLNNSSFFTTQRGNLVQGTDSALSIDGLSKAVVAFMKLKDPKGNLLGNKAAMLLVPSVLSATADTLFASQFIVVAGSTNKTAPSENTHRNKYRPVSCAWLDADSGIVDGSGNALGSDTAYYLLGDPTVTGLAPLAVSFLDGVETPTVDSADADFDELGIQFRGHHSFGFNLAEYLAGVKVTGVAP